MEAIFTDMSLSEFFNVYRASDSNATCISALVNIRDAPEKPTHLLGELESRVREDVLHQMKAPSGQIARMVLPSIWT